MLHKIEELLAKNMGLNPEVINKKHLTNIIEKRLLACQIKELKSYYFYLQTSGEELNELIEMMVIPETWFFRDHNPFNYLAQYLASDWLMTSHKRILRVLSVPCSSGEEPYSLAMTLLDSGLNPQQFTIDAVDISKQALDRAKKGIYTNNSFRGKTGDFQERYFRENQGKYYLVDAVKNTVNFSQANLLDSDFFVNKIPYHIIFCRNVLIYFDEKSQEKTIKTLYRLLNEEGLLFVGHSESGKISESQLFTVRKSPMAFVHQKKSPLPTNNKPQISSVTIQSKLKENNQTKQLQLMPTKTAPKLDLKIAQNLADQGNLKEAMEICLSYLKEYPTNVNAYLLLGQIQQAQGLDIQAEKSFEKALYLQPDHDEVIMHLILLKEHQNNHQSAEIFRQRLQRLKSG